MPSFTAKPQTLSPPARPTPSFKRAFAVLLHAGRVAYPDPTWLSQVRRARLCLRSLLCWHATQTWLEACNTPPLSDLVRRHPYALERMYRPFLNGRLNADRRLAVSLDHATLTQQRAPYVAGLIGVDAQVTLAHFTLRDQTWSVTLESLKQFQKEGDWTLCIRDMCGRRIVSCTFSVAYFGGRTRTPRLAIGSVQGADPSLNGRELFRILTRRWYGLRPKHFLIDLAQYVACALGAGGTLIVAGRSHVFEHWRYRLQRKRLSVVYDGFARACGAAGPWNGWFVLGSPQRYLARSDKDASGDAVHRRRHALRNLVGTQIRDCFARDAHEAPARIQSCAAPGKPV